METACLDGPMIAGTELYSFTKYLAYETARVYAEQHHLDVLSFLLWRLRPHDTLDDRDDNVVIPMSIAVDDLGVPFGPDCALQYPCARGKGLISAHHCP
jgi:hypothetical protein